MPAKKAKVLVIVGPTAIGKSDLAVKLAKKFNGEVVSADSRQVYTGLDIGSGKVTRREMAGVPHHMLDVASPKRVYSVSQYQRDAHKAIRDILKRGKLPILIGGTGMYIEAIVDNPIYPVVKPNRTLRKELEKKRGSDLAKELRKLDRKRAETIDLANKRRLVRAIEIARALGKSSKIEKQPVYDCLQIGLAEDIDKLRTRIKLRLQKRLRAGMLAEVKKLRASGLSFKRLHDLGLEYRYLGMFLEGKLEKNEMTERLTIAIGQYAKRQMTWFKRDKRIHWFTRTEASKATKPVQDWLK